MTPFTVLLGITLGSLVSIALSLAGVLLVFWILQDESPRFDAELPELLRSTVIFLSLAVIAGAGFFGTLKRRPWRHYCLAVLWLGLIMTGWYYWPE